MNQFFRITGFLGALACSVLMDACVGENDLAIRLECLNDQLDCGTTEEQNAYLTKADGNDDWVVDDPADFVSLSFDNGMKGLVALSKVSPNGRAYAKTMLPVEEKYFDLSAQEGMCLKYQSEVDIDMVLDMGDSVNAVLINDLPRVTLSKTGRQFGVHCSAWDNFRQQLSRIVSGQGAASRLRGIQLQFTGNVGEVGSFDVQNIYATKKIPDGVVVETSLDTIYALSDAKGNKNVSLDTAAFVVDSSYYSVLWSGSRSYVVGVADGIDVKPEGTGYWRPFNDSAYGGSSGLAWPVPLGDAYDESSINPVYDLCGGVCATIYLETNAKNFAPFAGVSFELFGRMPMDDGRDSLLYADVTESWKGICVTYTSDVDMLVSLSSGNDANPLDLPEVKFPKSAGEISRCALWSAFRKPSSKISTGLLAAQNLGVVQFKFSQPTAAKGSFNLRRFGSILEK